MCNESIKIVGSKIIFCPFCLYKINTKRSDTGALICFNCKLEFNPDQVIWRLN